MNINLKRVQQKYHKEFATELVGLTTVFDTECYGLKHCVWACEAYRIISCKQNDLFGVVFKWLSKKKYQSNYSDD